MWTINVGRLYWIYILLFVNLSKVLQFLRWWSCKLLTCKCHGMSVYASIGAWGHRIFCSCWNSGGESVHVRTEIPREINFCSCRDPKGWAALVPIWIWIQFGSFWKINCCLWWDVEGRSTLVHARILREDFVYELRIYMFVSGWSIWYHILQHDGVLKFKVSRKESKYETSRCNMPIYHVQACYVIISGM